MSIRKIIFSLTTVVCCSMPILAHANDLIINNRTDHDSASIINNGICSNKLGSVGITRAHEENHVVPSAIIRLACKFNSHHCQADVFISSDCKGAKIATVLFDVDTGIIGTPTSDDPAFDIAGSGFSFTLTQK